MGQRAVCPDAGCPVLMLEGVGSLGVPWEAGIFRNSVHAVDISTRLVGEERRVGDGLRGEQQ